jgi:pimeloyl-ACP methyl ester carboxylesterase
MELRSNVLAMSEAHSLHRRSAAVDGLELAYLECGTGPLAICVHGFPDTAMTWRYTLPALAAAGFRAVAPWLRGYAPSQVSPDGCHQIGASVADVVRLHEVLGGDSDAVVIGHDWGARIAGAAAVAEPDRWSRVVTMACPPFAVISAAMMEYEGLKRIWYPFFIAHPMADAVLSMNDMAFLDGLWADWSPDYDATEDLKSVKESLRAPENLAAALEYYRATFVPEGRTRPEYDRYEAAVMEVARHPHLYLHGRTDGCVDARMVDQIGPLLPAGSRTDVLEDVGHFLHLEAPDAVNRRITEFLAVG